MDILGSSKKINRYVYKALRLSPNGLNFGKIDQFVKYCNRNYNPVGNLTDKVAHSLRNYERYGIVGRTGNSYYLVFDDYKKGIVDQFSGWGKYDDHLYEKDSEDFGESSSFVNGVEYFENEEDFENEEHIEDAANFDVPETNYNVIAEDNNAIDACVNNYATANNAYRTKSLSSIPSPDLKRKKRKGIGYCDDDDDDDENVESHRKRRKIITVLDGRAEIKQGNSAKNDPISYPEDITFMNGPPEASEIEKLDVSERNDSAAHIDASSSEEIIIAANTVNKSSFDNNAENDLIREIETSRALFQRTHSYFYLN